MEGNGGSESCIEMPKAKNDGHLKREEYTHVA